MKGSLHTDELMHEVVAKDTGLRTARRISHVFVMDVPAYPRPLFLTDAAINIEPDLEDKRDIVQNAIDLARVLGIETPKVAILSFVETVSPKLRSTIDAGALCKMADRKQITGGRGGRPARLRQRRLRRGRAGQGDRLRGGGPCRHPGRTRHRGGQHARQATRVHGRGAGRGHRARRAGADRPDQPRGQADGRMASCAIALLLARKQEEHPRHDTRHPGAQRRLVERQVLGVLGRRRTACSTAVPGRLEGIGTAPHFFARDAAGATIAEERFPWPTIATQEDAVHRIFGWLKAHGAGLEVDRGRPSRRPRRAGLRRAGRRR